MRRRRFLQIKKQKAKASAKAAAAAKATAAAEKVCWCGARVRWCGAGTGAACSHRADRLTGGATGCALAACLLVLGSVRLRQDARDYKHFMKEEAMQSNADAPSAVDDRCGDVSQLEQLRAVPYGASTWRGR